MKADNLYTKSKNACRIVLGSDVYEALVGRIPLPRILEMAALNLFLRGATGRQASIIRRALLIVEAGKPFNEEVL